MINKIFYTGFLFIIFLSTVQASDNPRFIDKMNNPATYNPTSTFNEPESICGEDDLQHIEAYDGRYNGLGFNNQFITDANASVGAMKITATVTGPSYCSGTLISENEFLTASHCVGNGTIGDFVSFGYQNQGGSNSLRASQIFFRINDILEDGVNFGLDYAVLVLDGNPGNVIGNFPGAQNEPLGWKDVSASSPQRALIIQHPSGQAKQLDAGSDLADSGVHLFYSDIDTQPGSSGSGILNTQGYIVGIHTRGGCTATGGSNSGVLMSAILGVSNVIGVPITGGLPSGAQVFDIRDGATSPFFHTYNGSQVLGGFTTVDLYSVKNSISNETVVSYRRFRSSNNYFIDMLNSAFVINGRYNGHPIVFVE